MGLSIPPAESTHQRMVGKVLSNRYRIVELLSEGGMGAVFRAEHLLIGRSVAVKCLHPEMTKNAKAIVRFQREAHAAAAAAHDHIIDVFDLGYDEEGAPFMVMEFLVGESLADRIERLERMDPGDVCTVIAQVLDALSTVHAKRIIHRDLKPDNIFLIERGGRDDFVKLLDFGVSKVEPGSVDAMNLTRTGVMLGTPYYMSPEQARGANVLDQRIDLYALGIMMYEAITGCMPFDGENYNALLHAIIEGRPEPMHTLAEEVSPELSEFVHKAIAPAAKHRFQSARDMTEALFALPEFLAAASRQSATSARALGIQDPALFEPAPTQDTKRRWFATDRFRTASSRRSSTMGDAFRHASRGDGDEKKPPQARPRPYGSKSMAFREDIATLGEPGAGRAAEVRGTLLCAARDHIRLTHGSAALRAIIGALSAPCAKKLKGMLLPVAWFPMSMYVELITAYAEFVDGNANDALHALGKATAAEDLPWSHRALLKRADPTMAANKMSSLSLGYHRYVSVFARCMEDQHWEYVVASMEPDSKHHAQVMAGFFEELLQRCGAPHAQCRVKQSKEEGADRTILTLTW